MGKIFGLDLGTNSIGWAIRETDINDREYYLTSYKREKSPTINIENEIVDYGVVVFKKGVGEGKAGEFSLAAERRANRSKRRLYNAKRYRKWELLKVLIQNNMCPLTEGELRLWSIGNWQEVDGKMRNLGRIYPLGNEDFQKWLAFDPVYFGTKGVSEKGNPIRKNPYDLRFELLQEEEINEFTKRQKVGRALYHLVQRRGFRSSRKSGKSTFAENADLEKKKLENPDFHIATLAKEKLDSGERFRNSGVIQRKYFEDEFRAICTKQYLSDELASKLFTAIYYVRPLRSQKGLVGNCTLEKGKPRIPISHPKFEEFRALQFINNIKWREKGNQTFESIPISLKKRILEELYFRRIEKGANKGKVTSESYFKYDDIIEKYSENGRYEFNFKNKPNVSACPTIASLINIFDGEWKNKFIQEENRFGINWDGLNIVYHLKYGKLKRKIQKGKKVYVPKNIGEKRVFGVDEIWHLLFDYIQTKDNQEGLEKFCKEVIEFDNEKAKAFAEINIQQGYGSLSYSAIAKILPFLQDGYIYSEAVSFANLKKVLGIKFDSGKEQAKSIIAKTIKETDKAKERLNIVNGLIQQFFAENNTNRAKGVDNTIKELAAQETIEKLKKHFGESDWNQKPEKEKEKYVEDILKFYLKFLNGDQSQEEKASSKLGKVPKIDYYQLPRLDEAIKQNLKKTFELPYAALKYLYHPSDITMYPKSKNEKKVRINGIEQFVNQLESPQPPSKGWKNPMAMRTLHELRHLINYLLRVGKIDNETKVVVEMARELNDANKRWAIQTYQRYREEENKEFAKAIVGVAKTKYPNIDEMNIENINKVRLWWEQVEKNEEIYKEIKALKNDIDKYRLWKEQECLCMYTGETISLVDLFDGTQTHFEHTLPLSDSFDNSLSNLTVCKAFYNTNIKKNKIPTQLPNYLNDDLKYTAIQPRLKKWREKVEHLRGLIDENKKRTKRTQDPETKKGLIQKRYLLQFDYDYWKKKLETFTIYEIPAKWKNSQLVDTQIISKYARFFLKTVFERVDVIKAKQTFNEIEDGMVNTFKKIYQVKGDEQKDRSKHSHHATDAAILTLIPGSARRDAILHEYYKSLENGGDKFHTLPYGIFKPSHVLNIEKNILVNHILNDNTLTKTIKRIRKRGKESGWIAQGKSIRGQLHKETFFGAIKALERNEQGYPVKENGKYKTLKDIKNEEDEIWIVSRKQINDVNINKDIIVDQLLKQHIQRQLDDGRSIAEVVDFNNKSIRHIRVRAKAGVGFLSKEKALPIKEHIYISKKLHKRYSLAQNEENYLFLLYEGLDSREKRVRGYRILNLLEIAQLGINNINELKSEPEFQTIKKGNVNLTLKVMLKAGDRAIFYEHHKEEITNNNAQMRMFKLYKFNVMGTPYLYFQNHMEARPENEIEKEDVEYNPNKYQARLALKIDKTNCLFEGIDFKIKPDGEIKWIEK